MVVLGKVVVMVMVNWLVLLMLLFLVVNDIANPCCLM